jgi:hypothetical protein
VILYANIKVASSGIFPSIERRQPLEKSGAYRIDVIPGQYQVRLPSDGRIGGKVIMVGPDENMVVDFEER